MKTIKECKAILAAALISFCVVFVAPLLLAVEPEESTTPRVIPEYIEIKRGGERFGIDETGQYAWVKSDDGKEIGITRDKKMIDNCLRRLLKNE